MRSLPMCYRLAVALILSLGYSASAEGEKLVRMDLYGDPLPDGAIARMGTIRLNNGTGSASLIFSPDGKTLVSGSDWGGSGKVYLWEVGTGRELRHFDHHGRVLSVALAPDGMTLASAGSGEVIRLWDIANGKELKQLKSRFSGVDSIAFSPDGNALAAGTSSGIFIWEVNTGQLLSRFGDRGDGHRIAFSPDGKMLASGGESKIIRLWDIVTQKEVRQLIGHPGGILTLAFSPDGVL